MKVVVTKHIPQTAIDLLKKENYDVVFAPVAKAKGAHGLLCMLTDKIDDRVMDAFGPQLKVISNMAVGTDNIDAAEAARRGIAVKNTPDVLSQAVAEHTAGLILNIARRISEGDRLVRQGRFQGWEPELLLGTELQGRTLGIIGHGRIGCRTADIMQKGFQMKVVYYDVVRDQEKEEHCGISYSSMENVLKESDVVSLHVPLLPSTRHLIGERELRLMKRTAYLVNTARGAVVNEKALVRALKENVIAGAALDVFEEEPKLAPGLAKLENVLLTPHIGSATKETREKMAELAVRNITDVLQKNTHRKNV